MKTYTSTIPLRGHHLLCIQGYVGKGYSEQFIKRMDQIVEQLRQTNPMVLCCDTNDIICEACPKAEPEPSGKFEPCISSLITAQDTQVLNRLGLSASKSYSWETIVEAVKLKIQPADLKKLCKGCPWLEQGMCEQAISKLQRESSDYSADHLLSKA